MISSRLLPAAIAAHVRAYRGTADRTQGRGGVPAASAADLTRLPGVGEVTAYRIVKARETRGSFRDPKELLEIRGVRETQQYLVDQVQKVYRDQGVPIHDKHIELIVRQMTKRIAVNEQRVSRTQKSVISADQFGTIVDSNPGELLKWLPGVSVEYFANNIVGVSVRGVARSAYTGSGLNSFQALMISGSADEFVNRMSTLQMVAGHQNELLTVAAGGYVVAPPSNHISGGTYEYGYRVLNPWAGFAAGWMFLASKISAAGTVALGLAGAESGAPPEPFAPWIRWLLVTM